MLDATKPKFKDIEQYIGEGNYSVEVRLSNLERTLKDYEEDSGLDLCPDFQRGRVWTEEQQIAYVEYLLQGGESARTIYFNSPAFGKGGRGDLDDTILCVDGLQRLTSVIRFLRNEIPVFGYFYKDYVDSLTPDYRLRFNINSLLYKKDVLKWYLQKNSGGTPHTAEEISRVQAMYNAL